MGRGSELLREVGGRIERDRRRAIDDEIRAAFYRVGIAPDNDAWAVMASAASVLADREVADRMAAISPFVSVARELVSALDLGPFDRVVSVAVLGPDGNVRVVELGGSR